MRWWEHLYAEDDRGVREYKVLEMERSNMRLEDLKDGRVFDVPLNKCGAVSYRLFFRWPRPLRTFLDPLGEDSTQ